MDPLKSLFWNQGLFLKPQHFQHLSLQTLAQAQAYSSIKTGIVSGIANLNIDIPSLQNGVVQIQKLEAVLPDGTLLVFPGNCSLNPLSITADLADKNNLISIYIAVCPISIDSNNLSHPNRGIARYVENEAAEVTDLFDTEESTQITTLNIDTALISANELSKYSHCACIKIASISSQSGGFCLDTDYIAPVLSIASSSVLQDNIKSLKQSLLARFEQLESFSSLKGGQHTELSSASLSTLMALNIVAGFIPQVAQFEECKEQSPQQFYMLLRQLIAQLSLFSRNISVLGESADEGHSIVPYNQNNLTVCFSRAFKMANKLLDELTIDPELLIELTQQGESKFVATLSPEFLSHTNRFYLRLRSKDNLEVRVPEILEYSKLGADGQVDIYIKRALPGVKLHYLSRKPLGVASAPNSYYFSFDTHSFEWQKVLETTRVGLIWPDGPNDLQIEIIAVKG